MSQGRAVDGDEPLFEFDAVDDLEETEHSHLSLGAPMVSTFFDLSYIPPFSPLDFSTFSPTSTPAEVVDYITRGQESDPYNAYIPEAVASDLKGKAKASSQPVDIQPRDSPTPRFDLFSFNGISPGPSRDRLASPASSASVSSPRLYDFSAFSLDSNTNDRLHGSLAASYLTGLTTPGSMLGLEELRDEDLRRSEKGKSRAEPPVLPPLSFSPASLTHGETNWPLDSPSPESSHSYSFPNIEATAITLSPVTERNLLLQNPASRPRSCSSVHTYTPPNGTSRGSRSKHGLTRNNHSSILSRSLLLKSCETSTFLPDENDPTNTPTLAYVREPYSSFSEPSTPYVFRNSFSDFYKASVEVDKDVNPCYYDQLPREVKLDIFLALLSVHEAEGQLLRESPGWTASRASQKQHQWIGREKGYVELILISRVSKSWRELAFDGQLWGDFNIEAYPNFPEELILQIAVLSGSFIRSLNFNGLAGLTAASFREIARSLHLTVEGTDNLKTITQLSSINLSGCTGISAQALRELLVNSPLLIDINLKGLSIVNNDICRTIARHCSTVSSLDLSRCYYTDAEGIKSLLTPHQKNGTVSPLIQLRVQGLRKANDRLLSMLGRYAPQLEVLDLSGARELHNSALEAFVSCADDESGAQTILLTSREAGRDPGDPTKYKRRLTKLRHLSLSNCSLLSDIALRHLAYAVPKLEILELAGIGSELKDEGLVFLLRTTPLIQRLDLDEACDITDETIEALIPTTREVEEQAQRLSSGKAPETGTYLETLSLSYATRISDDTILSLIRACTRLKHLELDNTRVSGSTVKEFVRLSRKRQVEQAAIVVVDCRSVGENAVKDLVGTTRTRLGWRSWEARHLNYLDARDDEGLGVGTDECDEKRVALKSYYSWQTVNAVEAARETKRKLNPRKKGEDDYFSSRRSSRRWWSPGSHIPSPVVNTRDINRSGRDGCIIM